MILDLIVPSARSRVKCCLTEEGDWKYFVNFTSRTLFPNLLQTHHLLLNDARHQALRLPMTRKEYDVQSKAQKINSLS